MMRLAFDAKDGTRIVVLGLSDENMRRLRDEPIVFEMEELVPDWAVDGVIVHVDMAGPRERVRQRARLVEALATVRGRVPGVVLVVNDEVLAEGRALKVGIPMPKIEFLITRAPTEKDFLENYATLIGQTTEVRIDPRTL